MDRLQQRSDRSSSVPRGHPQRVRDAALAEFFPTRIRYTSMSLPYHIGNGWFGGLLPATAFAMIAAAGDIYYGLWYPITIAAVTVVIGSLFMPETYRRDILTWDSH